jgi:PAS domain S-box-containing protein
MQDPDQRNAERGIKMGERAPIRILIVDDVEENIDLLEDVLSEGGYECLPAHNGTEALEILKGEVVHLVVADAMMPKIDGFQLCKEARALPALGAVPFVIYTGNYVARADEEFARSIGVDRYVMKFAGMGALVEAVNELVEQRYGRKPEHPTEAQARLDDRTFLEKHRALVIRKLEEKMSELEVYAETLERKNRELQASEERYRVLFENASIAVFVIDKESGRIADANKQGTTLLGYSRQELLVMPGFPFAEENDFTRGSLGTTSYQEGEATLRRSDGEILDVEVGVGPVARPQDPRLLFYVRDITEQKKMREHLLQSEKMTIMGRLAAGIAHEVRNPLAAITLNLQYLATKIPPDPTISESIRHALEGTKRVESVIENTLSLARVTPPVLHPEEVNPLAKKALGFAALGIQHRDVRLAEELAEGLPPITVDAKQIQQVLLNILQNAIDASPSGGTVTLRTSLEKTNAGLTPAPQVCIAVRDEGSGIAPEQEKSLFQQFKTTKPGGTGLGLVLSRQIMERHRGTITLENAPGRGAVARLLFPVEPQEGSPR